MTLPTIKFPGNGNFCGGEIQNVKFQSLTSAPEDVTEARFWYDSVNHKPMFNNGTTNKEFGKEYSAFTGADGTNAGAAGLVPAPGATDNVKFLCGDGTYKTPTNTTYSNGTGLTLTGTTFAIDLTTVALKSDIVKAYTPAGNVAAANELPTLSADVLGNVYHVTTSFSTTSDFVEGSGKTIKVGNDITVVNVGTEQSPSYKFNVYGDFIDVSGKQDANTAVKYGGSAAVGSAIKGVYIAPDGTATEMTYSLGKSVPSDAVFTDTTYSAFTGADGTNAGATGLVPAPAATDNTKFLCGDGTFKTPEGTTYNFSTGLTNTNGTITVTDYNSLTKKITATNGALTSSNGVCTWEITNSLATADVQVSVYEVGSTSNTIIYPRVDANENTITITLLSASNISAGAYKAVVTG